MSPPPLVGVFGTGRNGSTLLLRLLDGSPDLWMHPVDVVYLAIFDDLARVGHATARSVRSETTRPLLHLDRRVPAKPLVEGFRFHSDELDRAYLPKLVEPYERAGDPWPPLEASADYAADEFLPALLAAVRDSYRGQSPDEPPRSLGFKTIEAAYAADYARVFPQLRLVHIVRHPLTNYASLKRTVMEQKGRPFWNDGQDILRTFLDARWLPHARLLARVLDAEPERHRLVRYEDLRADPRREILSLCDWLGIRPPELPDRQTVLGGRRMRELPPNASKAGVATPEEVVADTAARFAYDEVVTPREAALIARAAAPLAARLGYDGLPERSAARLWLDWLPPDSWELRNVRSWPRFGLKLLERRAYVTRKLLA